MKDYKVLLESNLEKAEIVLAVKGEIVDKLQRYAELIGNMNIDVLGPLLDRIKAENGLEAAASFNRNISGELERATDILMDVKDKISTETLKLTGDVVEQTDVSEIGDEEDVVDFDSEPFDMEAEADLDELDDIDVEPVPAEREVKESVVLRVTTLDGRTGTKVCEGIEDAKQWMTKHGSKLKNFEIIK